MALFHTPGRMYSISYIVWSHDLSFYFNLILYEYRINRDEIMEDGGSSIVDPSVAADPVLKEAQKAEDDKYSDDEEEGKVFFF